MSGGELLAIIGIVVMLVAAALLAAAETALTRISAARAEALAEDGRRDDEQARERPDEHRGVAGMHMLCASRGQSSVVDS